MNSYDYVRQKTSKWNEEKIRANNSESHHYMELKQFEFSRKLLIFFFEISLGAFRSLTYEQTRETNELMWIGLCRAARKLSILFKTRNISRWEFLVCRQGKDISSRGISSDHLSAHAENFSHWQLNKKNEKNKWKKTWPRRRHTIIIYIIWEVEKRSSIINILPSTQFSRSLPHSFLRSSYLFRLKLEKKIMQEFHAVFFFFLLHTFVSSVVFPFSVKNGMYWPRRGWMR